MPVTVTLNQNKDFKRVYYRGKSQSHSALISYVMKNRAGCYRIGITASKKTGNAVQRNRSRRLIRESFRLLSPDLKSGRGYDIVFVARARTSHLKMHQVMKVMRNHLEKAGLMEKEGRG